MMAKMRHPNTVLYLGFCPSPPVVVTEFCSRGSLLECLRQVGCCPGPNHRMCTRWWQAVLAGQPWCVYGNDIGL